MAEAARQVVHSHSTMNFGPYHGYAGPCLDRLDSRLMLSWAESARKLIFCHGDFAIRGIIKYAAAASKVSKLMLTCFNALEAAHADDVLSQLHSIQSLTLSGCCSPSILPATIQLLVLLSARDYNNCALDAAAADAIIWRARHLPNLRILSLVFPDTDPARLTSSVQLSALKLLELKLHVSRSTPSGLCLDWVRQQPVRVLLVGVIIRDAPESQRAALLHHIAALQITELTLNISLGRSIHAQERISRLDQTLWTAIQPKVFKLFICDQHTFHSAAAPLEFLPLSSLRVTIHFTAGEAHCSQKYVCWSALSSHAANIKIGMLPGMELSVLAAGVEAPEHLQQPWQLVVTGTNRVHGLPPSQLTDGPYMLPNAAARAAGWTA